MCLGRTTWYGHVTLSTLALSVAITAHVYKRWMADLGGGRKDQKKKGIIQPQVQVAFIATVPGTSQ